MKRLFTLLLACFMLFLAGCAEKPSNETPDLTSEVNTKTGIAIDSALLAENFRLVCDQIGMNADKLTDMEQSDDWNGGISYQFTYKGLGCTVFCNTDDTVEAMCVGEQMSVFDRRSGAYQIDDYIPEPLIQEQVESIVSDILKTQYNLSESDALPVTAWYTDRTCSVYNVLGTLAGVNESGEQASVSFAFCFEHIPENEQLQLRYYSLGEQEVINTMDQVVMPQPDTAIEQTASVLYSGDSGFLLEEGEEGKCGTVVKDSFGNKSMLYYLPAGTYNATCKTPRGAVYVSKDEYTINDEGYIDINPINTVEFSEFDEQQEIVVGEGEIVVLSLFAKVVFEPIS